MIAARRALALFAFLLAAVGPAWIALAAAPDAVQVSGRRLTLQGQGTRSEFFFDLYSVALYLAQPVAPAHAARIWDAGVPKALRVEILYNGDLPDTMPASWKAELLPALTYKQKATLERAYARLGTGDTIWITYAPEYGTEIRVGERVVLTDVGDALMRAFLDLWAGRNPVSKELRGALL